MVRWPSDCKLDYSIKHVASLFQGLFRDFSHGMLPTKSICFSLLSSIEPKFQRCHMPAAIIDFN